MTSNVTRSSTFQATTPASGRCSQGWCVLFDRLGLPPRQEPKNVRGLSFHTFQFVRVHVSLKQLKHTLDPALSLIRPHLEGRTLAGWVAEERWHLNRGPGPQEGNPWSAGPILAVNRAMPLPLLPAPALRWRDRSCSVFLFLRVRPAAAESLHRNRPSR